MNNVYKRDLTSSDIVFESDQLSDITPPAGICRVVVDKNGCYVGILSMDNWIRNRTKNVTVGQICDKNHQAIITEPVEARKLANEIITNNTGKFYVPILDNNHKPFCLYYYRDMRGFGSVTDTYDNHIIQLNDSMELAAFKLRNLNYLFVMDDVKLVGILERTSIQHALDVLKNLSNAKVSSFYSEKFLYATFETIHDDLEKFNRCTKLPVITKQGELAVILYRDSLKNLAVWKKAQTVELNEWELELRNYNLNKYFENSPSTLILPNLKANELVADCWQQKTCLEIGAGPLGGRIINLKQAKRRIIIEPLENEYKKLREKLLIDKYIDGIEFYSKPGDYYIPDLRDSVDGLIICHNALDHTPDWSFVLSNISLYAKVGAYFYLWTDIQHESAEITGHYSITPDPKQFFRLIEALGFELLYTEYNGMGSYGTRYKTFVSVVAKKVR